MSKLLCKCGELLSSTSCTNDIEGILFRDGCDDLDTDRYLDVWECNNCGMLIILKDCKVIERYIPEDNKPGNLLKGLK